MPKSRTESIVVLTILFVSNAAVYKNVRDEYLPLGGFVLLLLELRIVLAVEMMLVSLSDRALRAQLELRIKFLRNQNHWLFGRKVDDKLDDILVKLFEILVERLSLRIQHRRLQSMRNHLEAHLEDMFRFIDETTVSRAICAGAGLVSTLFCRTS